MLIRDGDHLSLSNRCENNPQFSLGHSESITPFVSFVPNSVTDYLLFDLLCFSSEKILLGIQDLLDNPNANDPANGDAYELFIKSKPAYNNKVKQIAAQYTPS